MIFYISSGNFSTKISEKCPLQAAKIALYNPPPHVSLSNITKISTPHNNDDIFVLTADFLDPNTPLVLKEWL
jgi:hypothetical protein